MATELDGAVTLRGLRKSFGERIVVNDVSLEIRAGEFFSLLGPSGCGKTQTEGNILANIQMWK